MPYNICRDKRGKVKVMRRLQAQKKIPTLFILAAFLLLHCISAAFASAPSVVCIDPGHPSETSAGNTKLFGITENEINWRVALQLKKQLTKNGICVIMTKARLNQKVTNKKRAEICNNGNAALMLRLHADYGNGTGYTVYYPDRKGEKYGVTGPSQTIIAQSKMAAKRIYYGMRAALHSYLKGNSVKGDSRTKIGSSQGALTGSIFARVPVVLVEMAYLNNRHDAKFIKSFRGQTLLAHALSDGILKYLNNMK